MKRPLVLAVMCVVLAAVSTGLLAACDGGPTPGSKAAVARQKANDTVISQLQALPGGKVTATIESSMDGGQNNIEADAVLPAMATTAQLNVMADTIERTIWLSHVDPLGRIGLMVSRQGDTDPALDRLYISSLDTPPLRVKYGPRPDGLPG
jgi:hypothetical protein